MVVAFSAHNWGNTTLTQEIITTQFQLGTWLNSFFSEKHASSTNIAHLFCSLHLQLKVTNLPWWGGGNLLLRIYSYRQYLFSVRSELVVGRGSHWGHVTSAPGWPRSPLVATRCRAPVQEQATNINLFISWWVGQREGEKRDAVTGMVKVRLMGKMMEIVLSPHWRV